MATSTSRLALTKPLTSENYDVTIVNANSDKIDAVAGFAPVTSATRPAAPFNGQTIRETDTGLFYAHNGSVPASAGWVQLLSAASNVSIPASASLIIGADASIFRSASNVLRTSGAMIVNGSLTASTGLAVIGNESVSGSSAVTGNMTVGGTLNVVGTLSQAGKPIQLKNRLFSGQIDIIPVANTPTLAVLTYPTMDGTVFRAVATANSTVPGTTITGVSVGTVGASACQVYVTRANTTSTRIYVQVTGSDS